MSAKPEELIRPTAPGEGAAGSDAPAQEQAPQRREIVELDESTLPLRYLRPSLAAGIMAVGTSFLIGGMFQGIAPRLVAAFGALAGVGLANYAARPSKRSTMRQVFAIVGIFFAGVVALLMVDPGALGELPKVIGRAMKEARSHKPPVAFEDGWRPLVTWTLACIAFAATWIGIVMRKPAMAVMLPMPVVAFAAIAQPPEAQVVGGIVVLLCFVIALAVIFRPDYGDQTEGEEAMPRSYEIRRALRTVPFIAVLTAALVALSQTNLLFPPPLYDPTQKAVLPKAVPLSEVRDRVLFKVTAPIPGPWRTGVLDVYDGEAWRLPPFAGTDFKDVPRTGVVDASLEQNSAASFTVEGLEGTVLPTPPRAAVLVGRLPDVVTDERTKTVRVKTGQVRPKFEYEVGFALLPTAKDLESASPPDPQAMQLYLDTAGKTPPPAVQRLLEVGGEGPLWTRFDRIRQRFLEVVVARGSGLPKEVPPSRIADMIEGSKEGTPFEIVAAQALIARWYGIPARIGYGFDGGEQKGDPSSTGTRTFEVHPKHGSLWLEVHFNGFGWLPVTGMPKQAKASTSGEEQLEARLIPSEDIAVSLFIPLRVSPKHLLLAKIQLFILIALPIIAFAGIVYALWPLVTKARRRARRRAWAMREGPSARIAVAYAEFRDFATDLGVGDPYATPLAFLEKVVPDEEHAELAWLVTRAIWGDLSHDLTPEDVFAAEELSRSLRRRLFEAQPITIRAIAFISRLSIRDPYAPELALLPAGRPEKIEEVAHVPA